MKIYACCTTEKRGRGKELGEAEMRREDEWVNSAYVVVRIWGLLGIAPCVACIKRAIRGTRHRR